MVDIEWIAFVTRHYHWLVKPFTNLVNKYLNVPLTFFSDRKIKELDQKHKTLEIFPFDCPIYQTSSCHYIRNGLNQIEKPLIAIMMMDMLPQNEIDHKKLKILTDFMLKNPIARGNLWYDSNVESQINNCITDNQLNLVNHNDNINIIKIPSTNPHIGQLGATSLMPAIWNKQFLLEFMEDSWSFDKIELPGQHKFMQQNYWYSVGTVPALEQIAHLMFTANQTHIDLSTIKSEDKQFVESFIPSGFTY